MKILIAGGTGFIGDAVTRHLQSRGHDVYSLTRSEGNLPAHAIHWNPMLGSLDLSAIEGFDAFINLCGENIMKGRWNDAYKDEIENSRLRTTQLLVNTLYKLENPPRVFINASAIGYFGNRNDENLTEDSDVGEGFLAKVCRAWEAAAEPAGSVSRLVIVRIGVVLSPNGGALGKMLTPFKMGLGGVVASGNQYVSWIAIDDLAEIFRFALENEKVKGVVNGVAPHPVTNSELTKTLGKVLHRPTLVPLPAFAARLAMGEAADELVLSSVRAMPDKLQRLGFTFAYAHLEDALEHLLHEPVGA